MKRSALPRLVVWAACLFLGASLAMLGGTQWYSARQADRDSMVRIEQIVRNSFARYAEDIAVKAVAQVYWDEAVKNLDHRFSAKWADEYVGDYLYEVDGIERTVILDRDDRLRYVSHRGTVLDPALGAEDLRYAAPLVAEVRRREARRPLPALPLPEEARLDPIVVHSMARIGGEFAIMSATLVQPDFNAAPRGARAPVVIFSKALDAAMLKGISDRFVLNEVRLLSGAAERAPGMAHLELRAFDGQPVGVIEWRPDRPGTEFLRKTTPALLLAALTMAYLAWLTILKGRSMARSLVSSEAAAQRMAYADALTGLANRARLPIDFAALRDLLVKRGTPFALLNIDLDHFKSVNDSFGHAAGDELICLTGSRLQALCGPRDVLARLGGDEFVMLVAGANAERAQERADAIIAAVVEPVLLSSGRVFIGASIGVLVVDDVAVEPDEALRRSDMALYRAKDLGRNQSHFFEPSMDAAARSRLQLMTDLRDALDARALALHYQPQVDRDGQVTGLEALVRWEHPELGHVPPARFVPIAEETGLIDRLGLFTIEQAFADSHRWPGLRVAINLSATQLRQADFVDRLEELVERHAVDPTRFEMEITEGTLLGDDPRTCQLLDRLHELGFSIALDDFGTGYSSLGYLQRYPIDKLKIDRSFVARIGVERKAESVVQAIVRLAHSLGMEVVAEGVETEAQWLSLLVAGCPEVQGYLTGRPTDADGIAATLSRQEADPARQRA